MEIAGKVVLITGASQGIGAACAAAFRRRGAKLALAGRSAERLGNVAAGGELAMAGDLLDDAFRRRLVAAALEEFGAIDILINNAGVGLYARSWEAPLEQTREMFEVNVMAPLALAQLVAPGMRMRRSGMIVNVGSIAGKVALPWFPLYSATKFAMTGWTDALRMELRRDGVRTMLVCPVYVKTEFQEHVLCGTPPEALQQKKRFGITAQRCAEDIARGVERDAREVISPGIGRLYIGLARLWPRLVESRMCRMMESTQAPV